MHFNSVQLKLIWGFRCRRSRGDHPKSMKFPARVWKRDSGTEREFGSNVTLDDVRWICLTQKISQTSMRSATLPSTLTYNLSKRSPPPSPPPGEDDDDDECGEEKLPSCFDYVMHFLTVFWKVLFAFVPPTEYWNGWACFVVSICMIGLLTAIIGTTTPVLNPNVNDNVFKEYSF